MSLEKRIEDLEREVERLEGKTVLPKDPVKFFRQFLRLKPYSYQAKFLRDRSPLKVLRWCRRAGKTTVMSGDDIHFAATHSNSTILIIMPKYQQIKEIYFQGEGGLHEHLARMKEEDFEYIIKEQLQTIIRFRNGSRILAEVPEPFTIRGHGPRKISIDEMGFIRKDQDLWLSALLPMTLTRIVYINVASTPWNKDSIYWKMCFDKAFKMFSGNVHEQKRPRYLRTWKDVLYPKGPLKKRQVKIMRQQYAGQPWRWKREMECAFVDDEIAFLPSSLIIKCQNEELEFVDFEEAITGEFYIGWDLGRERDPGAIAVIDLRDDVCCLVHCKSFKLGTPYITQMAYIKSLCDRWRYVNAVYYDHTGTKGIDEEIERAGFPGLEGVDFTKPKKHGMAMTLKQLMMTPRKADEGLAPQDARRRFGLPYDQDVQAELNVVQWEQTRGSEFYTFSHPEGSHDDRFWAIALAVIAAIKRDEEPTIIFTPRGSR